MTDTEAPTIQKTLFKNNTDGHIGATVLDAQGNPSGVGIRPDGTVWLSKAEQILTANAPQDPANNPFIEQTLVRVDPVSNEQVEVRVTPLTVVENDRYVPSSDRPIPTAEAAAKGALYAQEAATGDEPVSVFDAGAANVPHVADEMIAKGGDDIDLASLQSPEQTLTAPTVPPRAAAAVAAAMGVQESTEEADTTSEPDSEPSEPEAHDAPADIPPAWTPEPTPTPVTPELPPETPSEDVPPPPPAEPAPPATPPGAMEAGEETAIESPGPEHEETGAATQPATSAPEGSYGASEEVGTPDAPAAPDAPPSEG